MGVIWTILKKGLVAHKVIGITWGDFLKGLRVTLKVNKNKHWNLG
jgi:hypothetical protein